MTRLSLQRRDARQLTKFFWRQFFDSKLGRFTTKHKKCSVIKQAYPDFKTLNKLSPLSKNLYTLQFSFQTAAINKTNIFDTKNYVGILAVTVCILMKIYQIKTVKI